MGFFDEILEHPLGHFEVGDHAVLHRADGLDVAGRAPQHLLRLAAHGLDTVGQLVDDDDGGLPDDDPLAHGEDQGVGGPEIDGEVFGEVA
jgi:hypothetical protein